MIRALALSLLLAFTVLSAGPAQATKIEKVVSPGGIEAWLVQDHLNPIVSMRLAWRGGGALDPEGKDGLANMVSSLLDEGAGDLDSKTFQQTLEDNSITLRFDAGRDTFGARVQALTDYRDLAFNLLRQAMTKPRFDAEPVERLRAQILAGLRHESEQADAVAGKAAASVSGTMTARDRAAAPIKVSAAAPGPGAEANAVAFNPVAKTKASTPKAKTAKRSLRSDVVAGSGAVSGAASTAALPDGAVVLDSQGRIVWFNEAAGALMALRSPQDLGQRLANLLRHPRVSSHLIKAEGVGELEVPSPVNEADTLLLL